MSTPKTLYDKIWDAHIVHSDPDGTCLLYIDRHLVHEVTSPQAFEGSGRRDVKYELRKNYSGSGSQCAYN